MCTVCGLPSTHTSIFQTLSATLLLTSGVLSILWVYFVMTHSRVKGYIRRILDRLF